MIKDFCGNGNKPALSNEQVLEIIQDPIDRWIELTPLQRPLPPSIAFPVDSLGDVLRPLAEKMHRVIKAPLAVCGQSVLAAAALAVQGHADLIIDGRVSPVSEFFVTIAETGGRKSAVDNVVLLLHRQYQDKLRKQHAVDFEQFKNKKASYEKAREEATSKKNQGVIAKMTALNELGDPPKPPLEPFVIVEEPTYEGLVKLLGAGQPSLGLFTDEGGRFVGGHGMSPEHQLKTAAGLSGMWDGKPITRVRAGDGNSLLCGRRLSMHIMLQPEVAPLLFSNSLLLGQGLPSRCLVVCPDSMAGARTYNEVDIFASDEMNAFSKKIAEILNLPLPLSEIDGNELTPRHIHLSADAKHLFIRFHDFVERRLKEGRRLVPVKGLANKAPEHAARLAAVLSLFENIHCTEVTDVHMRAGIKLMLFYLSEALRLFDAGANDPKLTQAQKLLDWLNERGTLVISQIEIYRYGPNMIRNAKTVRALMDVLREHGYVRPHPGPVEFENSPRRNCWEIRQQDSAIAKVANLATPNKPNSRNSQESQCQIAARSKYDPNQLFAD